RQIARLSRATEHLNGELISAPAEQLLQAVSASPAWNTPREIVLELTPRRHTRPIYWPGSYHPIERPDLSEDSAAALLEELANIDDLRLILAGAGDPLLSPAVFEIIQRAADFGIAVAVETDLIGLDESAVLRLAESAVDIISVHLPAATAQTYLAVMQFDGFKSCLENLRRIIERRQTRGSGTPLIVPTFTKTQANLAEMEPWYDHWQRLLGCAV